MDNKTLQLINHDIIGMKELLYKNVISATDFIVVLNAYNKKYKIKMKLRNIIKDHVMLKSFTGNIKNENIYSFNIKLDYLD